jgi:small-conductance mechanosensitive channel
VDLNEIVLWVVSRGISLLVGGAVILLLYRVGVSAVHRLVPSVLRAQAAHLPTGSTLSAEVDKRVATIEDLLIRLLRLAAVALLGALVLAVFDLWSILAGIVLIIVALLFATQDVVLDYVMGFLILVEGPYFKGDWVKVGAPGGVEGEVEEIGLRRTVLRDGMGSVHAVSNGLIRQSSNVTRVFSVATVDIAVPQARDLDRAIEAVVRVDREMRADPAWSGRFLPDSETDITVIAMGLDGASLRIQQRVATGTHGPVQSELRRRLAAALVSDSIGTGRWDTPMPITNAGGSPIP